MIRVYYMADDEGGGGDDPKKGYKDAPMGYQPLTPANRKDWNAFLDWMQSKGLSTGKDIDDPGKNIALSALEDYQKENQNTSLKKDMIPFIQYEQRQIRSGNSFAGMNEGQLKVFRQQLSPEYLKSNVSNVGDHFNSTLAKEYYPTIKKGEKDYGTDIEDYAHDLFTPSEKSSSNTIPLPNYNDPTSRMNYLRQWAKKYGDLQGRGDTVLKINETPRGASNTAKNISIKAAKEFGIDPALLYSSAMEEGMSGLFKDRSGLDTRHRKPTDFGYQDYYNDKEFPINGANSFGFQTFAERFPELVKGGYLPKEFSSQFRGTKEASLDDAQYHDANNFKSVESAMRAKAAMFKYGGDYVEKEAKKHNIELSTKQKEFFTLAWFNGGEGAVEKRLPEYKEKGYLKNDDFIKKRPAEEESVKGTRNDVWGHIVPRIQMAENINNENLF